MTTIDDRREWLRLLETELARRAARVEWQAGADERARLWFLDTLQAMAQRLGATAHLHPLQIDDMSCAEMLACHFLPEHLRPAGLGTEDEIFALAAARGALKQGQMLR
jgi:hypothetical protein